VSARRKATAALVAAVALAATLAAAAVASPPRPADLRVVGGGDNWHPESRFDLTWTNPPVVGGPALARVHYRIRDPLGTPVVVDRLDWVSDGIAGLTVPGSPGSYTAEVWLEDTAGQEGPPAAAQLRFDNARPAAVGPLPVPTWIGRTAFPLRVRLSHPAAPLPISGIRGYAAAIDAIPGGSPCAATDRCTDAETTLRRGQTDDELTIASLPQGIHQLHVAAVSGSGMKSASSGQAVLRVDTTDPVTLLAGAPPSWTNRAVWLIASATDAGSGMEPSGGETTPFTAIRVDGAAATIAPGATAIASVIADGMHRIAFYARDAAGNVNDGGEDNGIANRPAQTTWFGIDRVPPGLAFANSQEPRDPELVHVRIGDRLSGPDPGRGWIGVRVAGSGDRFEPLPPAPPRDGEMRARWSSDAYPAGEYEFQATGYDTAGNVAVTSRRRNGTAMVLSNPLKATTSLGAGFGASPRERTIPYGRGIRVGGRLMTGIRSPLGGMPVRIVERFAPGAATATRVSTVRTGPDGSYALWLAPGPSRDVVATFGGSSTLSRSASRPLHLAVRSALRLRTSAATARIGGAPLVFRGRVGPSASIPAEGKSVQLQFRLAGLPWSEFRIVQTDRHGRFRYAYRFSDDDSRGALFQFRAYAPAQDGWPFEPAGSRPVIVRGR
jgi:hypothetical protein